MRRRTILAMLCAAALVAAAGSPDAWASNRQLTIMQDDAQLRDVGDRARTLDEFEALGADVVKVQVFWDEVAPSGRRKPSGFEASDPGSSRYSWSFYDEAVRGIVERGMRPFLVLGNRAPDWATAKRTRRQGTYRPSAKELRLFAAAAGARYSGSYAELPRVEIWSIWNEPNLFSWLAPQRRRGVPLSPSIYRELYLAGYRGLRDAGHGGDRILIGELMPLGAGSPRKVPPLEFLRELACLDRRYRPYRGRAARARGCAKVGRIPTSGLAYHPYTPRGGVRAIAKRDEASISTLGRLTRVLDALARRGKLPRRLPVWITEYGFQTDPPDPFQYSIRKVPGLMDESEWIAFRDRRVASYSQYTIRDEPPRDSASRFIRWSSFQLGLRFVTGRAKPGVYDAFRMPAFVRLSRGGGVEVFGALRAASGGTAQIESRVRGGRYRSLGSASLNGAGYFRKVFRVRGGMERKYRITIGGRSRVKRAVSR